MSGMDLAQSIAGQGNIDRIQRHGLVINIQRNNTQLPSRSDDAYEVSIAASLAQDPSKAADADQVSAYSEALVSTGEQAAVAISKMIDNTIHKIDTAIGMSVTFKALVCKGVDVNEGVTINLLNQIKETFDFVPAMGSIDINKDENTVEMTWLLSSIPSFLSLCTNARSRTKYNIFRLMTDTVRFTGDKHGFDMIDEDMLINTLTDNNDYREWSNHMLISLITTILDRTRGFTFQSIIWEEDRVHGNNKEPVDDITAVE